MDKLTKEQAKEVVSAYNYFIDEDTFVEKISNKFHITKEEACSIYKILDVAFIRWG